jgi:hypothetical protein
LIIFSKLNVYLFLRTTQIFPCLQSSALPALWKLSDTKMSQLSKVFWVS